MKNTPGYPYSAATQFGCLLIAHVLNTRMLKKINYFTEPYNHFTSLPVAWNDQENKDGRYEECGEKLERKTLSFPSEIFKSLSFRLDRLCHLAILCLDQHAHTLHHLKLLNNLHLIDLISLKEDLVYPVCAESLSLILSFHILNLVCYGNVFVVLRHEHVVMNPTFQLNEASPTPLFIRSKISLTGFPAQSVWSSNTDVLDLPCLLVLITDTSQSRQHVDTSLIHRESCKSPTAVLFDDDTGRIFHSSL
ncbi:hypothetical protein Tco_0441888 [Tanacetum coccineum]